MSQVIKEIKNIKKQYIPWTDSITDIKAIAETGRQYDIEMQVTGNESFKHRSLYYRVKPHASQLLIHFLELPEFAKETHFVSRREDGLPISNMKVRRKILWKL